MAGAMLSHPTFFSDLRQLPPAVIKAAGPWARFHAKHRALLTEGVTYPLLNDPLTKSWTALQTWDPLKARGAVAVFRQSAGTATTKVALRNIPSGKLFSLYEAPTGKLIGRATSAQLQRGLTVTLPQKNTARLLLVLPAGR
jgi:hypothetical protein